MKVTAQEYRIIERAMEKSFTNCRLTVANYEGLYFGEPMEIKVNWACLGDVSASEAEEFGRQIMIASRVAVELNNMEIVIDLDAEGTITDKDAYLKMVNDLSKGMSGGSLIGVRRIGRSNGLN